MAKTSFVLRALSLLGPGDILKLSAVIRDTLPLKKAAGEELIVWNDTPKKIESPQKEEAKVLAFKSKSSESRLPEITATPEEIAAQKEIKEKEEQERPNLLSSDMVLWQREMSKDLGGAINKLDAVNSYQRSTQMYVVKSETIDGKQKIRFASTDGILVNKKQA